MSLRAVVNTAQLDKGLILAPERYDPRRRMDDYGGNVLSDSATEVNERRTLSKLHSDESYLVLDTSDAQEGMILSRKSVVPKSEVGSTKKVIRPGDVIISRLRPYLRQVALADDGLFEQYGDETVIMCSTEYYVLRSRTAESIAYLVPVLLSSKIQRVLDASQEGGHHPRFNKKTLMSLSIPPNIANRRDDLSNEVESAVRSARTAVQVVQSEIEKCSEAF